jgi:hypothetical protein
LLINKTLTQMIDLEYIWIQAIQITDLLAAGLSRGAAVVASAPAVSADVEAIERVSEPRAGGRHALAVRSHRLPWKRLVPHEVSVRHAKTTSTASQKGWTMMSAKEKSSRGTLGC